MKIKKQISISLSIWDNYYHWNALTLEQQRILTRAFFNLRPPGRGYITINVQDYFGHSKGTCPWLLYAPLLFKAIPLLTFSVSKVNPLLVRSCQRLIKCGGSALREKRPIKFAWYLDMG